MYVLHVHMRLWILSDLCMLPDHVTICFPYVSLGSNVRDGGSMIYTLSRHVLVHSLCTSMGSRVREGNSMISIVVPLLSNLKFWESVSKNSYNLKCIVDLVN